MYSFYPPEGLKPRLDEASLSKFHAVISKSASLPQPILSSSPSQPAKPQTIHERKHYTTSPEISHKESGLPNKLYEREKQSFSTPNIPHHTQNRGEKMRQEKKTKRGREGGSPKDHNSEGHVKSSFIPPSTDSKMPNYMNPIKTETPSAFIPPELYHNYLGYHPQVYQLLPGMPGIGGMTPDQQQNMLQHGLISMPEVKTEPEKSKPKSQTTHKASSNTHFKFCYIITRRQECRIQFRYFRILATIIILYCIVLHTVIQSFVIAYKSCFTLSWPVTFHPV